MSAKNNPPYSNPNTCPRKTWTHTLCPDRNTSVLWERPGLCIMSRNNHNARAGRVFPMKTSPVSLPWWKCIKLTGRAGANASQAAGHNAARLWAFQSRPGHFIEFCRWASKEMWQPQGKRSCDWMTIKTASILVLPSHFLHSWFQRATK